uniref:cyclin-dependent kinase 2-associated protein 2-like isoform X2 n=1 Tax=Myxine glutinosa TaxID=7769 RepID=UPI00358E3CBD
MAFKPTTSSPSPLCSSGQAPLPPRPIYSDYGPPSLGYMLPGPTGSQPQSKYAELLAVIEELGRDVRPTYAGSKSATERLKRGIIHARALVRECLAETERSARS